MLVLGLVVVGIGSLASSSPASAHTPSVSATCSALNVNLVNYQVKPGSPEIPGTLITPEIAAWDEPGNPGQPYIAPTPDIPATYTTEYLWQSWNWDTLVFDQKWSASSPGIWWGKVHPVQSRQGPELTPFIAGNPGQPYIAPTPGLHHDAIPAVYGPATPAVPADSTPNNVVVTIDGVVQDNVDFGGSFVKSYTFSSQFVAHTYSVVVTAWDDPSGSHGWTKTYEGTTTPCYDNSLRPSLSANSQCGSWTGEFNNPTKYGWVFDYQVDGEAASGPGWGTGPVYQTVYIPAFGGTQTRTVTFPEDTGNHTVMYRLNVGPEQDWYIPAVTVNIETDCEANEVTPVPATFTPPTCDAVGTLVGEDTDVYIWIRTGSDSEAVLTAVATTAGTNLTGQTSFGPYDLTQLTGEQCETPPVEVTPAAPTFTPGTCTRIGTLNYENGDGYIWTRTGPDTAAVLTATAIDPKVVTLKGKTVYGPYDLSKLTGEQCETPPIVHPVMPTVTHETIVCNATDYSLTTISGTIPIPVTPGLEYLLDGKVVSGTLTVKPGTYKITYRPTAGYEISDGIVDLTVTVKAATAPSCVKPTPPVVPPTANPNRPVPAKVQTDGAQLIPTSDNNEALIGFGLLLAAGGAAWLLKSRRREAQD